MDINRRQCDFSTSPVDPAGRLACSLGRIDAGDGAGRSVQLVRISIVSAQSAPLARSQDTDKTYDPLVSLDRDQPVRGLFPYIGYQDRLAHVGGLPGSEKGIHEDRTLLDLLCRNPVGFVTADQ